MCGSLVYFELLLVAISGIPLTSSYFDGKLFTKGHTNLSSYTCVRRTDACVLGRVRGGGTQWLWVVGCGLCYICTLN